MSIIKANTSHFLDIMTERVIQTGNLMLFDREEDNMNALLLFFGHPDGCYKFDILNCGDNYIKTCYEHGDSPVDVG